MNNNVKFTILVTTFLCLIWSVSVWAKDDASTCVEPGALEIIPNGDFSAEFETQAIYVSRLTLPENCGG
jgi:hypothetical protein